MVTRCQFNFVQNDVPVDFDRINFIVWHTMAVFTKMAAVYCNLQH